MSSYPLQKKKKNQSLFKNWSHYKGCVNSLYSTSQCKLERSLLQSTACAVGSSAVGYRKTTLGLALAVAHSVGKCWGTGRGCLPKNVLVKIKNVQGFCWSLPRVSRSQGKERYRGSSWSMKLASQEETRAGHSLGYWSWGVSDGQEALLPEVSMECWGNRMHG